ncbi:MAG: sulfite exporter TauE/SafE family protein, partial [Kingella oralis]
GRPIWQRLNPRLNKLLPLQSLPACVGAGMLWGWLPCGLVYNASLYALGSSSALWGGLYLLAFGLGTLPNLIAAGLFASQLRALLQKKWLRRMAGLLVSVWAVIQLARVVVQF